MPVKKTYRVSIKGILVQRNRVLLLRKPNRSWDLPGGRIELGESPETCLIREFFEETGLKTAPVDYAGAWIRTRRGRPDVFCMAFHCAVRGKIGAVRLSDEHIDAAFFSHEEVRHLMMVEGCRRTILQPAGRSEAKRRKSGR